MANNIAFQPMGNSVCLIPTAANTQSNVVTIQCTSPSQQYLVTNHSNVSASVRIGTDPSLTVALPTEAGTPGFCVAPGNHVVITGPQVRSTANTYARAISNQDGLIVTIVPGEGL
jgi:hypothetical protein